MPHDDSLEYKWEEGLLDRDPFIRTAREGCSVTLPALAPDLDGTRGARLVRPLSNLGARGVNNLAAKLSVGLYPPQGTFFRYDLDVMALLESGVPEESFGDVKLALSKREKAVQSKLDRIGFRSLTVETFQQLIVSGNYLIHQLPDGTFRGFRLDQFQTIRNGKDEVERILARELIARHLLEEPFRSMAKGTRLWGYQNRDMVDLFTYCERKGGKWETWQEVGGMQLTDKTMVTHDNLPWIPLRMVSDSNEDYGRSFLEGYMGPLTVLEALEQSIVDYAAVASRVVPWINPASGIRPEDIASAQNGKPVVGDGTQMGFIQVDKLSDFQVILAEKASITEDLRQVFLLLTPFRNAERVTQEEIRQTVAELTESLGGPFATMATEFQLPIAIKTVKGMIRRGELQSIPLLDKNPSIKIVTGLDAIGRSRDEAKLQSYLLSGQQGLGPDVMSQYIDPRGYLTALAAAQGIDPETILLSEEEVQQRQQAAQQQAFLEKGAGPIVKSQAEAAAREQQQAG